MKKRIYFLSLFFLSQFLSIGSAEAQSKLQFVKKKPVLSKPTANKIHRTKSKGNTIFSAANNECNGATTLTFGVPVSENNIGATESRAPIECNFATSNEANDVWFTFVYTSQMDSLIVVPQNNNSYDIVIELFTGSCGNLISVACADYAEPNSNNQTEGFYLSTSGAIIGNTYKLRVYGYDGTECNFVALIKSGLPPAPENDACATPTILSAGVAIGGNSVGSTESIAPIVCNTVTSTSAKDVWYRFTKTSVMDTLALYPDSPIDYVLEVRSNGCPGASIICSDKYMEGGPEKISLSSLTNGTVYLARAYGIDGTAGTFAIKIKSAPINNNCSNAIALTPSLNCNVPLSGTTIDASQSAIAIPCGTKTGNADDDVWYSFVMQTGMDTVRVIPGPFFDAVMDLRSGACVGSVNIKCSDNPGLATATEKIYVGDLIAGTKYYLRIYSFDNGEGYQGNFQICLTIGAGTPPGNDNCATPIVLNAAELTNGSNINSTQSAPGVPCGGFTSPIINDVWYSFTKNDQTDSVIVDGLGMMNITFDIRTNNCTTGTPVGCTEEDGTGAKKLDISALANGTYLLRVYGYNGATGAFTIFLKEAVAVTAPPNDECFDGANLIVGTTCSSIAGTNVAATETQAAGACSGAGAGAAKDVWYTFSANSTKAITRLICGIGFDGAIEVFSGSCFGLTSIGCSDTYGPSTPDDAAIEQIVLQGLISGQQYFVRVYGYQGDEGTFNVCVFNPSCTSTPAVLTTSSNNITGNQAFTTNVTGATGLINYETSSNQTVWNPAFSTISTTDTLVGTAVTSSILYIRVNTTSGNCYPSNSNVVPVTIRCATPFTNSSASNDYIKSFKIGSIDNLSSRNPLGGNVQDFTTLSTGVCRGTLYPVTIGVNIGNVNYNRLVWIDYNQDGDFNDPGENPVLGTYTAGASVVANITIPVGATLGTTKLRVAIIDNNATITSSNPCATGPYAFGEIEEYTINITNPVTANAGSTQTICAGSATLSGNDPGAGSTGLWTVVSGTGVFADATLYSTVVSGLTAGANVFKWTITSPCGNTNANVTITTSLIVSNAGQDQSVCAANATFGATTPSAGSGVWTLLSGSGTITTAGANNSTVTNLGIGANKFIWTVTSAGCPVAKDTVTISRTADPSNAVAGADQNICANSTSLAATVPVVGTGVWSTTGAATITTPTNASTTVTGLVAGANTFTWTVSNGTCTPKTANVVITVQAPPTANAGTNQNTCSTTVAVSGNVVAGATYNWAVLSGAGTFGSATNSSTSISGLNVGLNRFIYSVTRTGCPVAKDTIDISRKAVPVATVGPNFAVCSTEVFLTGTNPTSGTGMWSLVSGSALIAFPTQGNSGVSNLGYGANVFRWTVSDSPCTAATADITITNNLPSKPNAGIDKTACDQIATLTGSAAGTLVSTWSTIVGSGNVASPASSTTLVTGLGIGINQFVYSLDVPACSTAVTDTVTVTRQANPISLGKDTLVCQNLTPTFTISGPAGMTSYSWGPTPAVTQQLIVSTAAQYILTVVTPQNCTFMDTINVNFGICDAVAAEIANRKPTAQIQPNPSVSEAFLRIQIPNQERIEIEILDMKGVHIGKTLNSFVYNEASIALPSQLSSGTYVVHIKGQSFTRNVKWIVTK